MPTGSMFVVVAPRYCAATGGQASVEHAPVFTSRGRL